MNTLLEGILESGKFLNSKNSAVDVHSTTSREQCDFLQDIIRDNHLKHSIEIGFAYGASTLAITEEIVKNGGKHVVIDKFQNSAWGGNGIDLLKQAGYSEDVEFHEEFCYMVLPGLLKDERRFDFAYIDSTKQLDWLLVDFFFLDKIMDVNGIIVFDDVTFPGIRKLLRYLCQFPNYQVHAQFPANRESGTGLKFLNKMKSLPRAESILRDEVLRTDADFGINAHAVALRKTAKDERNWDWHVSF